MANFKAGWYLIYTKPRHEKKVAAELAESNINHLLPTLRTLRTRWDRKKYIDAPMFPSYIFVRLQNMQEYFYVLGIDGALCYVKFGKEVATVRAQVIDNLRFILESSQDIEMSDLRFKPGQQLTIQEGVFTSMPCEVVEHKNEHKIIVRINLLNTVVLASLPGNIALCPQAI